jgi:hypothetical protein
MDAASLFFAPPSVPEIMSSKLVNRQESDGELPGDAR